MYTLKTRTKLMTMEICGRKVKAIPVKEIHAIKDNKLVCADCGQPASLLILEPYWCEVGTDHYSAWFYCGVCEVG